MTTPEMIAASCLAVLFILVLILLFFVFRAQYLRKNKTYAKQKVSAFLKRFSGIRSFQVLNDITLPLNDRLIPIDHILIGFFGVMIVDSRDERGNVYGSDGQKTWTQVTGKKDRPETEKRQSFPNPVMENQLRVDAVRKIFTANRVYKTDIESYVVFAEKKVQLAVGKIPTVLSYKDFKRLLGKERYSADGPVDVKEIASLLSQNAVR